MHWKLTAALALSLAWLAAPAARAQDTTPDCCDYNGFYAGLGGGYAIERFPNGGAGNSAIANARVGYRFLDFLALEGEGEFAPHFAGKSGVYNNKNTQIWSGWLNAKLYPLARWTGFIQPYLLAGGGYEFADTRASAGTNRHDDVIAGRFGAGIDFFLTEHIFLTTDAAYILPAGDTGSLERVQVGGAVQYRF